MNEVFNHSLPPVGNNDWHLGLCNCFSKPFLCCAVVCCNCCLMGKVRVQLSKFSKNELNKDASDIGELVLTGEFWKGICCTLWCTPCECIRQRHRVRIKYEIWGGKCTDCCLGCCCCCCSLYQIANEVNWRIEHNWAPNTQAPITQAMS